MVSLESAFNAEQENDIIFAVTCTTEEIKIQMKPMTALVIQATVDDIHSASLVVMVYIMYSQALIGNVCPVNRVWLLILQNGKIAPQVLMPRGTYAAS